jgi:hypothetical protein
MVRFSVEISGSSNPSQSAKSRSLENPLPAPMRAARQRVGALGKDRFGAQKSVPSGAPQSQYRQAGSNLIVLPYRPLAYPVPRLRRAGGARIRPDLCITGQSRFAWSAVDETASLTLMNSSVGAARLGRWSSLLSCDWRLRLRLQAGRPDLSRCLPPP